MNHQDNEETTEMNEKIISRIQKLLALAEKGNNSPEEAYSAMLKAQELLLSNNLTMSEVQTFSSEVEKEVSHTHTDISRPRMPWWWKRLAMVVASNMRCFIYTNNRYDYEIREHRKSVTFIGLKDDVEAATLTLKFAIRSADSCYKAFKKVHGASRGNSGLKNDYLTGFIAGLKQQFADQVTTKALILVKDALVVQEYSLQKLHKSSASKIRRNYNDAAREQGFKDGQGSKKDAYIA